MTRVRKYHLALIAVAGLILVVSLVRVLTGYDDLTSSGTVGAALILAVPIALAGLGGLWAERAGVVNIGLEGMMVLGTWFAGWAGYQWGPWAALVAGLLGGAVGGLLHAVAGHRDDAADQGLAMYDPTSDGGCGAHVLADDPDVLR